MSKEQIKIRRSWLINPDTKIEESKKTKQKFREEKDEDWGKYTGFINEDDLKELEDEKDNEDDNY
jgi:hypothetical protein